jgi:hypothetical protein
MISKTLFRVLVTAGALALVAVNNYANFVGAGLPFSFQLKDSSTAVVQPVGSVPLPAGFQSGDEIDIPALDPDARSALLASGVRLANMTGDVEYRMVLRRNGAEMTVPAVTRPALRTAPNWHYIAWVAIYFQWVLFAVVLITFWLGRDRTTLFIGLWALAYIIGDTSIEVPLAGHTLYYSYMFSWVIYFLGRLALYVAAESLAGTALSASQRLLFRTLTAIALAVGLVVSMGGGYMLVERGSAAWIHAYTTWLVTVPYIVTAAALVVAQRQAFGAHRIRIQWMMWSLLPFIVGILARTVPTVIGREIGIAINTVGLSLGLTGTLYAIFRHRVVDVRVLLDRTLVYGATTSLVIGVIAAMNSLALRMTVSENTSILLQIIVPLSLGIVLGKVQDWMDRIVEQVFFRKKYLREKALRDFAERATHIDNAKDLLDATVREIARQLRTPAIAVYSAEAEGFRRMRHMGKDVYPAKIGNNDDAALALKTYGTTTDLLGLSSALGVEGSVIPMLVFGNLRGLIALKNRPGERFAADEKELLTHVAREVGNAWRVLRARDNEALIANMAKGSVQTDAAFAEARRLSYAWAGN